MPDSFDEQGYRRKLIDGGLSEADATALARRYAAERNAQAGSAGGAFRPAGSLFELPATAATTRRLCRRSYRRRQVPPSSDPSAWRRNRPSWRGRWACRPNRAPW
jgi:hypothetical protein